MIMEQKICSNCNSAYNISRLIKYKEIAVEWLRPLVSEALLWALNNTFCKNLHELADYLNDK